MISRKRINWGRVTLYIKEYGTVYFTVSMFNGHCGACIVSDALFVKKRGATGTIRTAYADMLKFIKTSNTPFDLDRSRVFMSDHLGGTTHRFIQATKKNWQQTDVIVNKKTGNQVAIWWMNRDE